MEQGKKAASGKIGIWLPLLFSIVLIVGMLIGLQLSRAVPVVMLDDQASTSQTPSPGKLEELLRYIESKYVDSVDRDQLVDDAIYRILEQLDPHSSYIPAEDLQHANEQLKGNFEGIGVEYMMLEDTMVVVSPLPGGPSEEAGLRAGDKIVMVDDSLIAGVGMRRKDLVSLLRGQKGTEVVVGIKRGRDTNLRRFTITRDEIDMNTVDAAYMLDDKTGYIKLNFFSATTYEEFMQALEQMVDDKGMKDLIIDLRHNPGGYLQQATQILSQLFRQKGELLVYTEGYSAHRTEYKTHGRALFDIEKIAVLIDENSASASEIMAGALQDHDRALIVGRRSFGKGLVQEPYMLSDGSALRLTVARFYTPSGRSIQKSYDDMESYREDVWHRIESGELTSAEKQIVLDSAPYFTDKGRKVYGGGGIQPDVFVPLDPVFYESAYMDVRPYLQEFIYRQKESGLLKRQEITSSELNADFALLEPLYQEFRDFLDTKALNPGEGEWDLIEKKLKEQILAEIADLFLGKEAYFRVLGKWDPVLQEARSSLRNDRPISKNG